MTFGKRSLLDVLIIPLGLIAFAVLVWWAIYAGPDNAGKVEARRMASVEAALSTGDYAWASVEMDGQTAVLTGEAPTEDLREQVRRRVKESAGRGGWFWGGITQVRDKLTVQSPLDDYLFLAELNDFELVLSGAFPGTHARDRLIETLHQLGYTDNEIEDQTVFADGVPDGDWIGAVELGLTQLVRLSSASMRVENKTIYLRGQAPNAAVRLQVLQRMTRPPSGYSANVDLTGTAVWTVRIDGDQLTLSGAVPDAAYRTELVELASRFFDGQITNSQIIRPMESTSWLGAVRTILPNFLQFRSGEIVFMGDELIIRGEAPQSIIDFMREDSVRVGTQADLKFILDPVQVELTAFKALADDETPSREVCEQALSEAMALGEISFRYGSETLNRESGLVLDAVETVIQVCDDQVLEIEAYTHIGGQRIALQQLTEARQRTISDYFIARGVPLNKIELTNVEAGVSAPRIDAEGQPSGQIRMRLKE